MGDETSVTKPPTPSPITSTLTAASTTFEKFWQALGAGTRTTSFADAPNYLKCNRFVRGGYRAGRGKRKGLSAAECLASVGHVHNETGNIVSHLLPLVFYVYFLVNLAVNVARFDVAHLPDAPAHPFLISPRTSFAVFAVGSSACFFFSTAYHIFNAHSFAAWRRCLDLDYLGISLGFMGAAIGQVYPHLYCFPDLVVAHQAALTAVGVVMVAALNSRFNAEENVWALPFRGALLSLVSLATTAPYVHHWWLTGSLFAADKWFFWSKFPIIGAVCAATAVIYTFQLPERFFPGTFDIWGHSHQLMHLAVAFNNLLLLSMTLQYFDWRVAHGCAVP